MYYDNASKHMKETIYQISNDSINIMQTCYLISDFKSILKFCATLSMLMLLTLPIYTDPTLTYITKTFI